MWRKAFSPSTLTAAVVVVVVVVVTGSAASDHTSLSKSDLTQEIAMSLKVNQLAILKGMNESSSLCASRDRDYHLWKEEANQQLQAAEDSLRGMAEEAKALMHMTEETKDSLRGMAEDAKSIMQAVEEVVQTQQRAVEERMQTMEEAVQAQERTLKAVEAVLAGLQNNANISLQVALQALHNDTEPSRCDSTGVTKVLHGATGTLYSSILNQNCWWRVVMPAGTRPLFHWELPEEDCGECDCGVMTVFEVRYVGEENWTQVCYGQLLDQNVMKRLTSNEFMIRILNSRQEGAVSVHYQAVPIN